MDEEENDDSNYSNDSFGITRFKIVFVGDSFIGKTSIIDRIIVNSFKNFIEETIGVDVFSKKILFREKKLKFKYMIHLEMKNIKI